MYLFTAEIKEDGRVFTEQIWADNEREAREDLEDMYPEADSIEF